jgi:hypothetical protein
MSTRDAKPGSCIANAQSLQIVAKDFAGMCWIEDHFLSFPLVVIQVVDQNYIGSLECKRDSPIAIYRNGPVILERSMQLAQFVAWRAHIAWCGCRIQRTQKKSQTRRMFRSDACLGTRLSKPLQAFVTVALDHLYSVYTHYTSDQDQEIGGEGRADFYNTLQRCRRRDREKFPGAKLALSPALSA